MLGWQEAASPLSAPGADEVELVVYPPGEVEHAALTSDHPERAHAAATGAGIDPRLLSSHGAHLLHTHRRINAVVVRVRAAQRDALVAALEAAGSRCEDSQPVAPQLDQSVPQIGVPDLWRSGYDGTGITVAVIDTGCDPSHPDLVGRLTNLKDFTGTGFHDDVGHGTHVCGTVAGRGAIYRGVAPGARLMVGRALTARGGRNTDILAGVSWAAYNGADVISLSLGGPGSPDDALCREVDALTASGIVVCVAAGNSGPAAGSIGSPGMAAGAITVGAVTKAGALASYSSRGPVTWHGHRSHKPDLLAPGGDADLGAACPYPHGITAPHSHNVPADDCTLSGSEGVGLPPASYQRMSGTSMATPHVAGLCALLLQASGRRDQGRAAAVKLALMSGAHTLGLAPDSQGAGVVNGPAALAAMLAAVRVIQPQAAAGRSLATTPR